MLWRTAFADLEAPSLSRLRQPDTDLQKADIEAGEEHVR